MSSEIWNFVGRKPRHHVADASQASVRLERAGDESDGGIVAELIDFARNGARLRIIAAPGLPLPAKDEAVVLRLRTLKPGVDIRLPGAVRWLQAEGPGQWLVGCEFQAEVSLETLGELFLNEILSDGREPTEQANSAVEPNSPQG